MDKNEIERANRKALPQFMLIMVICFIIGGTIGFCSAKYGLNTLAGGMKTVGMFFGTYIAPWLMLAAAVIVPVVCVPIYQSATKLLASWDGENEEMSDTIDEKLSIVIWVTSAALILSYFLIAASYANGFETFKTETSGALFLAGIIGFLTIMIEAVIFQQKCVDTTKKMNPEKTASVYDMKFQKKWMESCDEAEKIMIGKCAFKAYAATNTVCSILSIVLAVCALVFGIGFLPSLVVCLIWIVNQSMGSYLVIIAVLIIFFCFRRRRRTAVVAWQILNQRKQNKENVVMKELAKQFIGEECIIYTITSNEGSIQGVIKEIDDGGMVIERNSGEREIVNLDFVTRIRQYPRKKNGKKKDIVLD